MFPKSRRLPCRFLIPLHPIDLFIGNRYARTLIAQIRDARTSACRHGVPRNILRIGMAGVHHEPDVMMTEKFYHGVLIQRLVIDDKPAIPILLQKLRAIPAHNRCHNIMTLIQKRLHKLSAVPGTGCNENHRPSSLFSYPLGVII